MVVARHEREDSKDLFAEECLNMRCTDLRRFSEHAYRFRLACEQADVEVNSRLAVAQFFISLPLDFSRKLKYQLAMLKASQVVPTSENRFEFVCKQAVSLLDRDLHHAVTFSSIPRFSSPSPSSSPSQSSSQSQNVNHSSSSFHVKVPSSRQSSSSSSSSSSHFNSSSDNYLSDDDHQGSQNSTDLSFSPVVDSALVEQNNSNQNYCSHCKRSGHIDATCFTLHPDQKKAYRKRRNELENLKDNWMKSDSTSQNNQHNIQAVMQVNAQSQQQLLELLKENHSLRERLDALHHDHPT